MSDGLALERLQLFLRLLAIGLFSGTIAELLAVGHDGDPIQFVPFLLCGLGLLALAAVWKRPGAGSVLALRGIMTVIALGSLLGVYEHIAGNIAFVREIHPHASTATLVQAAVTGGAPLMAPGILTIGAAVAIAATYASAPQQAQERGRPSRVATSQTPSRSSS